MPPRPRISRFLPSAAALALAALTPLPASAGKSTAGASDGSAFGRAITTQPDGSFLVAGRIWNGSDFDLALLKFLPDGSRDPSFGNDGIATLDLAQLDDFARSLAVQDDGKILVGGFFQKGSDIDFFLARFTPTGQPDTAFATGGTASADFSGANDRAHRISLAPDGTISLTGYSQANRSLSVAEARFTPDGQPDLTFGNRGLSTSPTSGPESDLGDRVLSLADGSILTAGQAWNGSDFDFALRRFLLDGTQDSTFGARGTSTANFADGDDEARALAILPNGQILAVGDAWKEDRYHIAIAKFHPDGTPDTSFGADHIFAIPPGEPDPGGDTGGPNPTPSSPANTWSPYFELAASYYNHYAAFGYYYYAAAYYHYFYGLGYYTYYSAYGKPAEALLYYHSGFANYFYYAFLASGDLASANFYYYYYLAFGYYHYYASYADFPSATFYYYLFLGYAFAS